MATTRRGDYDGGGDNSAKMIAGANPRLDVRSGSRNVTNSATIPNYVPRSGFFTIRLHHGGKFSIEKPTVYFGGSVLHCDYCSKKNLSFGMLDSMSELLGCGSLASCVFTDPALGLSDGLTAIVDEDDIKVVAKFGITHGFVDVYLIHSDGSGLHGVQYSVPLSGVGGQQPNVPDSQVSSHSGTKEQNKEENKGQKNVQKKEKNVQKKEKNVQKKEQKKEQNKVQNSGDVDASMKRYYSNLQRSLRAQTRKAKKQGIYREFKGGPSVPYKEVGGVLHLDGEEINMNEDEGPPVTQATQPTEVDNPTPPVVPSDGENDDEFWKKVDDDVQNKINREYERNMSELEGNLKNLEKNNGKGILFEDDNGKGNISCGSKRKRLGNEGSGECSDGLDGQDGRDSEFVDSEYEVDDDSDLDELVTGREPDWTRFEYKFEEQGGSTHEAGEDETDSDSDWEEPCDGYNSDGLYSQSSSDSEGQNPEKPRVRQIPRFVQPSKDEDVLFKAGQLFISREEFQNACKHHGTVAKRRIRFRRSNQKRCTAYCTTSADCQWMVSVNYRPQTTCWELTCMVFHHTCATTFNHKCAGAKYLAERYKDEISIMPNITARQLIDKIQKDLHIIVSKDVAAKARKLALKSIEGDWKQQYIRMKEYCNELKRSNPGSTVVLQTEKNAANRELFRRLYVCFDACKKGFTEGCRPMIGMDGCHLTGPHKGILLAAIGLDGNDQIFPIAYALVEIECSSSWLWFLTLLRKDLGIKNSTSWTLLTDKQKGLANALNELFPNAEHRMCTWHLYKNFKGSYPSLELKEMLWAAAKSTHTNQFQRNMDRIRSANPAAYEWLNAKDPENWARAYFKVESKCDILVNNICECFNRVILHARDKPVLTMLEAVHYYFMDRLQKKRVSISKIQGPVGPKIAQKLEKAMRDSNEWFATHVGDFVFGVKNCYESKYEVRLGERVCSCRKWQLTGIPCAHAVAAIGQTKEEPMAFLDPYYSKEMYSKAYKYIIYPVNGPDLWDKLDEPGLLPPKELKIGGRPPKSRKKGADEKGELKNKKKVQVERVSRVGKMSPYKCSFCKQTGHTVKKCPTKNPSLEPQPNPTPTPVPKKVKKAQVCSSCKNPGHNMITCKMEISDRYQSQP